MLKRAPVAIMVMLIVVMCMLPACASKTSVPVGLPSITSFTVASENVSEDECPVFYFEVADCSYVSITQDGEKVMEVEAMVPGSPATLLPAKQGVAYALPENLPGTKTHYSQGVYPIGFKGASNGKPSKVVLEPGDLGIDSLAEIEVRSWDGQVYTAQASYTVVPASERSSDQRLVIAAPDCAPEDASATEKAEIKSFTVKNPTLGPNEAPQFEFSVANTNMVKIYQSGELVFYVQAFSPDSPVAFLPHRLGVAYALPENQPGVNTHYCQGVYPAIYRGSSSGRPATIISNFGKTGEEGGSAALEACSPRGGTQIAILTFFTECTEGCECLTQSEAKSLGYTYKSSNMPCGEDLTQPPIDGYQKKYCFKQCPDGCACLTKDEGAQSGYYTGTAWIASSLCTPEACGVDKYGQKMHCVPIKCPDGCDCLTQEEGGKRGCYSGTSWPATRVCIREACGVDEYGQPKHCCPKPPLVECNVSPAYVTYGGGQVQASWTSEYADKVTMTIDSNPPNQVPLNSGLGFMVTKTTCFTFTAENKSGSSTTKCCVHAGVTSPGPSDLQEPPTPPPPPPPPPAWSGDQR
jgi:hypothetical protein